MLFIIWWMLMKKKKLRRWKEAHRSFFSTLWKEWRSRHVLFFIIVSSDHRVIFFIKWEKWMDSEIIKLEWNRHKVRSFEKTCSTRKKFWGKIMAKLFEKKNNEKVVAKFFYSFVESKIKIALQPWWNFVKFQAFIKLPCICYLVFLEPIDQLNPPCLKQKKHSSSRSHNTD